MRGRGRGPPCSSDPPRGARPAGPKGPSQQRRLVACLYSRSGPACHRWGMACPAVGRAISPAAFDVHRSDRNRAMPRRYGGPRDAERFPVREASGRSWSTPSRGDVELARDLRAMPTQPAKLGGGKDAGRAVLEALTRQAQVATPDPDPLDQVACGHGWSHRVALEASGASTSIQSSGSSRFVLGAAVSAITVGAGPSRPSGPSSHARAAVTVVGAA